MLAQVRLSGSFVPCCEGKFLLFCCVESRSKGEIFGCGRCGSMDGQIYRVRGPDGQGNRRASVKGRWESLEWEISGPGKEEIFPESQWCRWTGEVIPKVAFVSAFSLDRFRSLSIVKRGQRVHHNDDWQPEVGQKGDYAPTWASTESNKANAVIQSPFSGLNLSHEDQNTSALK